METKLPSLQSLCLKQTGLFLPNNTPAVVWEAGWLLKRFCETESEICWASATDPTHVERVTFSYLNYCNNRRHACPPLSVLNWDILFETLEINKITFRDKFIINSYLLTHYVREILGVNFAYVAGYADLFS
jgi:hypothetical protein